MPKGHGIKPINMINQQIGWHAKDTAEDNVVEPEQGGMIEEGAADAKAERLAAVTDEAEAGSLVAAVKEATAGEAGTTRVKVQNKARLVSAQHDTCVGVDHMGGIRDQQSLKRTKQLFLQTQQ